MSKQDPNYHPNEFFIGLEEHKTFPYRETIQRQIKNRSEQQLIGAYQFEIELFPKDSQMLSFCTFLKALKPKTRRRRFF